MAKESLPFDDDRNDYDDDDGPFLEENELEVHVWVKVGEINSIMMSTDVVIDKTEPEKAQVELQSTVALLRRSIPMAEIHGEDKEYHQKLEAGIEALGPGGEVTYLPKAGRGRKRRGNKNKREPENK